MPVEEGLLDPASFAQYQDSVKAVLNMETPVIGVYPHPWMDGYYMDPISERRVNYEFRGALEGPGSAVGLNGEKAVWEDMEEIWQKTGSNSSWRRRSPNYHPPGTFETLLRDGNPNTYNYMLVRTAQQLEGLEPAELVPARLVMDTVETDAYVEPHSSIDTYLWENISKFIVGDRDVSEWDGFIAEFDNMNMDAFVAVIQSGYTRMPGMK